MIDLLCVTVFHNPITRQDICSGKLLNPLNIFPFFVSEYYILFSRLTEALKQLLSAYESVFHVVYVVSLRVIKL